MGRSSARKGAAGEREVQAIFRQHGYNVMREGTQTFGTVPDLYNAPALHLEVKRAERLALPAWISQSERDAAAFCDGAPTVIFRSNGEPWRIVLRLEDFLPIYEAAYPPNMKNNREGGHTNEGT